MLTRPLTNEHHGSDSRGRRRRQKQRRASSELGENLLRRRRAHDGHLIEITSPIIARPDRSRRRRRRRRISPNLSRIMHLSERRRLLVDYGALGNNGETSFLFFLPCAVTLPIIMITSHSAYNSYQLVQNLPVLQLNISDRLLFFF